MTVRQAVQYGLPYVQITSLIKQIERNVTNRLEVTAYCVIVTMIRRGSG
jgi:hypothetical protein